jgi:hypothetical protein
MLHLLPEYQKKKVLTEYRLRLIVVLILLVAFAILMFAIFLMPSYAYLYSSKSELVSKKHTFTTLIESRSSLSVDKNGGDAKKAISALKPLLGSLDPLLYIDALSPAGSTASSVRINSYFLTPIADDKVAIMISGVASSREGLTKYAGYLNEKFGGVKLPLSSLAKQSDIPFDFKFEVDKQKFTQQSVSAPVVAQ